MVRGPTIQRAFGPAGSESRDRRRQRREPSFGLSSSGLDPMRCLPTRTPDTRRLELLSIEQSAGRGLRRRLRCTESASTELLRQRARGQRHRRSRHVVSVGRRHEPPRSVRASVRHDGVRDDNGKRATAAEMRYGCRRGECFEGYEPRCGERRDRSKTRSEVLRDTKRVDRGKHVSKRNEPCPNRAARCPNPPSGGNRRGGGNPRGRNEMCSGWSRHTEGRWQHRPGVDARGVQTGGREQTRVKPKRGGSGDRSGMGVGALKVAPSPWRTR